MIKAIPCQDPVTLSFCSGPDIPQGVFFPFTYIKKFIATAKGEMAALFNGQREPTHKAMAKRIGCSLVG